MYSTIANGGVRVEPTLVRGTKGAGRPLHPRRRSPGRPGSSARRRRRPSPRCWSRSWTTRRAPAPRRASPATGSRARRVRPTAWIRPPARYHGYTSSFAGFAPADKPRITVYCAIQNATKGSYFGGQICGPVYKQVMEFALKTLQVPPDRGQADRPVTFTREPFRPSPDQPRKPARNQPVTTNTPDPGNSAPPPTPPAPSLRPPAGTPGTLTAVPHADQSQTTQKGAPVTYPGPPRPVQVSATPLAELAGQLGAAAAGREAAGVTGITHDSRAVRPGDLYAALPGARLHGADFVTQAAGLGAVAVLTDPTGAERAAATGLPVLVVDDPRGADGRAGGHDLRPTRAATCSRSASPAPPARPPPPTSSRAA